MQQENYIESQVLRKLTSNLEKHHAIFYKLWEIGTPKLTEGVETACVKFDQEGFFVEFLFNNDLWNKLNDNERLFIISHECLHLILNHGKRAKGVIRSHNSFKHQCLNIAMDLVINHMLTLHFNFNRSELGGFFEDLCWIDKFFQRRYQDDNYVSYYKIIDDKENVLLNSRRDETDGVNFKDLLSKNRKLEFIEFYEVDKKSCSSEKYNEVEFGKSFEYYYQKVKEFFEEGGNAEHVTVLDAHETLPDIELPESSFYQDPVEEVVEEAADELYEDEKNDLNEILEEDLTDEEHSVDDGDGSEPGPRGDGSNHSTGTRIYFVPETQEDFVYTWEDVVDNFSDTVFKDVEETSWISKNRRFSFINGNNLMLPNEHVKEKRVRDNVTVWVFQDVSGSCSKHKDYFFNAIESIPDEKFDVRAFCFAGKCKEMGIEERKLVQCGFGTRFDSLNKQIKQIMDDEECNYPEIVFVITDGRCSDQYYFKQNCTYPGRWKFFFTNRHSKKAVMDEMDSFLLDELKKE